MMKTYFNDIREGYYFWKLEGGWEPWIQFRSVFDLFLMSSINMLSLSLLIHGIQYIFTGTVLGKNETFKEYQAYIFNAVFLLPYILFVLPRLKLKKVSINDFDIEVREKKIKTAKDYVKNSAYLLFVALIFTFVLFGFFPAK